MRFYLGAVIQIQKATLYILESFPETTLCTGTFSLKYRGAQIQRL